jgi:putative DNA primase/helicase
MSVIARRLRLLKHGYEPVACDGKLPVLAGWQRIETTPAEIERWTQALPHATNTGIRTKHTPAVDIDIRDLAVADQVQQALLNIIGDGGTILQRVGLPPKRLIPFQRDLPFRKISTPSFKISLDDPDRLANRVEVLADGQQFVAEGIHPDTCRPYQWANNVDLAAVPRDLLPVLTEAAAREFVAEATRIMTAAGWHTKLPEGPKQSSRTLQPRTDDDERIASALSAIPADDRDIWFTVGAILKDQPGGRDLWDRWSQNSSKYDADDQERVWRSIGTSTRRAKIATLFHLAQQHGWRPLPLTEQAHKPWRAAGYFLRQLAPESAWRTFQYWCRHYSNLPIEKAEAEWIFQTLLKKEYCCD